MSRQNISKLEAVNKASFITIAYITPFSVKIKIKQLILNILFQFLIHHALSILLKKEEIFLLL